VNEEIVLQKMRSQKPKSVKMPWAKKVRRPSQACILPWEVYGSSDCALSEAQVIQALKNLEKQGKVEVISRDSGVWWCLKEPVQELQTRLKVEKREKRL